MFSSVNVFLGRFEIIQVHVTFVNDKNTGVDCFI